MGGILIDKKSSSSNSILIQKKSDEGKAPTRHYSDKQEKAVGKLVGATQTSNSGATMFDKGDLKNDNWLIECKTKTTHSESMSIKKEWLEKNKSEALFMNKKYNALAFNFGPDEENYFIIDEYLFQDLIEYLKNKTQD